MTSSSYRSLMAFAGVWLFCLLLALPSAYGQDAFSQSGVASWYGPWHHGKSTATGEAFDMFAMTAAHRTLPLGTLVKVEHLDSGKSVIVRINDRGPYVKNRIIDLSYAAADSLGLSEDGISRVNLEIVGDSEGRPLSGSQAFFVRLADDQASSDAVAQQLRRLICLACMTRLRCFMSATASWPSVHMPVFRNRRMRWCAWQRPIPAPASCLQRKARWPRPFRPWPKDRRLPPEKVKCPCGA